MKKREKFKRLINFLEGFVILAAHTVLFAFVWYGSYVKQLDIPFFRRGDWAVIGVYALILFLLTHLYGGFKIGYLRLMDVLYSQILSLICANVVAYIQQLMLKTGSVSA